MEIPKSSKIPCTIAILTHNSASTLKRALESARDFAEIIICDGNSSDSTRDIAHSYGAKIIPQDPAFLSEDKIINFAGVRNQTLSAATYPWFFFLDADESLSEILTKEIAKIVSGNEIAAYYVHRRYELNGEVIACASTYPNRNMRFFHLDAVTAFVKAVHERIEVKPGASVLELRPEAFLIVPVMDTPAISREKNRMYIEIEVKRIHSLSLFSWIIRVLRRAIVSLKYLIRELHGHFFCDGKSFPFSYEVNRHWYHILLSYRELSRLGWKTKLRD